MCKSCHSEYRRDHYLKNHDKYKAKARAWESSNKNQHLTNRLKYKYGITIDDYEVMLSKQDGKCEICKDEAKLVVDHNHTTSEVRALLCPMCNLAVGHIRENSTVALNMALYLQKYNL